MVFQQFMLVLVQCVLGGVVVGGVVVLGLFYDGGGIDWYVFFVGLLVFDVVWGGGGVYCGGFL